MRPLDPRLLKHARSVRWFLVFTVGIGALTAGLVILQARLLSDAIVAVAEGTLATAAVPATLAGLGLVFLLRALAVSTSEVVAFRAAARAKEELRSAALREIVLAGLTGPAGRDPGGVAALVTRGIDGLDAYFARYLPQLVLAVIVPLAVLLTVLGQDLLSAVIIAVTLPLIPLFMVLVGWYTAGRVERQWRVLAGLTGHFLDLIAGLPTLKAFGRAKAQAQAIRAIGDEYRRTTMGVLRVAFLSALVLELLASLSVALVAVTMGVRLAEGQVAFSVALFVLILAPEAYLPLRLVGQHYHAAAEGLGAADRLFALMAPRQMQRPDSGSADGLPALKVGLPAMTQVPDGAITALTIRGAAVRHDRGTGLEPVSFDAEPGSITAIVGRSGSGKSTLLLALMGMQPLDEGMIEIASRDGRTWPLAGLDPAHWRHRVGWVPQHPRLIGPSGTESTAIREVVTLGCPQASDAQVWGALTRAGVADEVRAMAQGLQTLVGADGTGVSVGQRQRLALARALIGNPEVLLLDEPTAALDGPTEASISACIADAADAGAIVILVTHRPALVAIASQLVRLEPTVERCGARAQSADARGGTDVPEAVPASLGRPGW